jgi:hypothetical protein
MPSVLEDTNAMVIARARALAACQDNSDLIGWYVDYSIIGTEELQARARTGGLYAGAFGSAQALITELLAIIGRAGQDGEAVSWQPGWPVVSDVPMMCVACRRRVHAGPERGQWIHDEPGDTLGCTRGDGPVRAMVDTRA